MEFNLDGFLNFLKNEFQDNYTKAGKELQLSVSQIQRIATNRSKAGQKSISLILNYCNKKNIDWSKILKIAH